METINKSILKKYKDLKKKVSFHQDLYYKKNSPEISDYEFDLLFKELQNLEKEFPDLQSKNSPTRKVGSDLSSDFIKFKHTIPVLSLENTYNEKEIFDWITKTSIKEIYSIEWKVDGASIVLYYEKGILKHGVTRGTGGVGDEITNNIKTIKNLPWDLKKPITGIFRGEVYMNYSDFNDFNQISDNRYANPRNLVSGSIKNKTSSEVALRPLRVVLYDSFISSSKNSIKTNQESIFMMEELGLPIPEKIDFIKGTEIIASISQYKKLKDTVDFPIDGLVIKLNNLNLRNTLGNTSHSPRWARAYKFDANLQPTVIEEIQCAVGRTGKITPRAKVTPISISGTTVSYATLHNQDYINELGIGIGAKVNIAKRGEIIPAVEEVIEPGSSIFELPKKCPSCGKKVVKKNDSVDFFCINRRCPDRALNTIIFFCQRKQMNIEGLGEKQIEFLFNNQYIHSINDLYKLHLKKVKLIEEEGFGEISVNKILKNIEDSKKLDLKILLPSLGLEDIGHKTTELLIESGFNSIDKIIKAANNNQLLDKIEEIKGIGPSAVEAIKINFTDKEILKSIDELKSFGLNFQSNIEVKKIDGTFSNQTWCVTGSFENFSPREKALELIKLNGGKTTSDVSNKTTHLLTGESAGSKLEKAKKNNVQVITEKQFLTILKKNKIQF